MLTDENTFWVHLREIKKLDNGATVAIGNDENGSTFTLCIDSSNTRSVVEKYKGWNELKNPRKSK